MSISCSLRSVCFHRPDDVDNRLLHTSALLRKNYLTGHRLSDTRLRHLSGGNSRRNNDQCRIHHPVCHIALQKRVWQYKNRIRCITGNYCSPLFMAVKRAHRRSKRRNHHHGTHYRTICSSDHASPDIHPSLAGKIWRSPSHSSFSNRKQPATCHHHLPRIRKRRTSGWGTDSQNN